jgi:hypothetical protein
MSEKPKAKKSTVRHTRAIARDRSKRPNTSAPDEQIAARLQEIVHPATLNQVAHFHDLGLRERTLNLPVMMAFVLSLIWRQLGSVAEAVRTLNREGLLWVDERRVSQQAVEQRLGSLPPVLFKGVLDELLPQLHTRWRERTRPLAPALAWAHNHFAGVVALDGSTLDALLHKTGLLRERTDVVLAGRMAAVLDVVTRLPRAMWYEPSQTVHDIAFWERALHVLERNSLVIFDLGFLDFARFDAMSERGIWFVTRKKERVVARTQQVLRQTDTLHDTIVHLGSSTASECVHPLRLVKWHYNGKWYAYLTSVIEPERLPAEYVVALYWQRWRIEDSFNVIKRLLGLAYLWTGSSNGVQNQVWATWILYAVLVDLTDAVAETLNRPFHALSMEMVYRGLYHYTVAHHRGKADDPIAYLAAEAKGLGVIKPARKNRSGPTDLLYLTIRGSP